MRIAIFMAQTDTSDFARAHPDDGQKFAALLRGVRPGWQFDVHRVAFGDFPERIEADGGLITGSIASVNDDAAWIARLADLVRDLHAVRRPLFGACFGHQLIASALGGRVGPNPGGWCFGLAESRVIVPQGWMVPARGRTLLHAAHGEQVLDLPAGAVPIATGEGTPVAAFSMGRHVATTQYHPEMDRAFFRGLFPLAEGLVPRDRMAAARAETRPTDNAVHAEWIARFFETAHQ